jgi:hypothetical protein
VHPLNDTERLGEALGLLDEAHAVLARLLPGRPAVRQVMARISDSIDILEEEL